MFGNDEKPLSVYVIVLATISGCLSIIFFKLPKLCWISEKKNDIWLPHVEIHSTNWVTWTLCNVPEIVKIIIIIIIDIKNLQTTPSGHSSTKSAPASVTLLENWRWAKIKEIKFFWLGQKWKKNRMSTFLLTQGLAGLGYILRRYSFGESWKSKVKRERT